ncbi:MAG: hypothetical protein M1365_01070 [Actinobacteria bacterium]|nr:hypothetical protein [Actinomycetota bacterium]
MIYISLVAILLRGYSYGTGDQAIHLPLIFRLQDSALYPNDYLFLSGQSSYSFFYPIIAYLQSLFNNDARIYFIYYVITLILLFIMITAISNKLFGKGLAWFFSLLLFIFPYYIGGSAILTVETSFVPRVLTHLLSLYILFLLLSKKYLLSFFFFGFEFLIHPLSAIWTGVVVLTMTALDKNINRISILIKGLLIVLLLTSLLIFPQIINLFRIETNSPTTEWLSILMERNSYAFPLLWTIKGWLSLLLGLLPISFYLFMRIFINKKIEYKERFMIALLISGIITLVFQIIFTGIFPLSSVISLQLGRIWF